MCVWRHLYFIIISGTAGGTLYVKFAIPSSIFHPSREGKKRFLHSVSNRAARAGGVCAKEEKSKSFKEKRSIRE